ncbi:rRNA N6-adenosine-methyltransferase METTL5-like [Tigriopus californicus]|uniref:rRNA N6-adenosine-methyltransferase METTL5-like n=1 Tax=Tigriopus californicus TaxID=6832 RepID=UPI0027DA6804|nr:rRNA N6-adenosine-methyltransferase METTL5-like [Tigriopus californicus]|eukprot:TCALIF_06525-PA protein Name:"Similar to Mettl5 Methyltransferase-like protein 5 (Mus musculus)" AED:0.42 eAED:0.42 QI:0/-1/0/1/-1/1/1/0/224
MTCRLKLNQLQSHLQGVEAFDTPKVLLEQYPTSANIAACMLHTMQTSFHDLEDRQVADLGCGCGVLSIGALMLGAHHVKGFEIDPEAGQIYMTNMAEFDMDASDFELIECDVTAMALASDEGQHVYAKAFDTVIMNPPFGTKHNKGIDMTFVQQGLAMAKTAVYSLHKTATREHILKKARDWGVKAEVLAELRYDLPATYKHHKKPSVDIQVDFIRFSFDRPRE